MEIKMKEKPYRMVTVNKLVTLYILNIAKCTQRFAIFSLNKL